MRFAILALGALGLIACSATAETSDEVAQDMLTTTPACLPKLECAAPALKFEERAFQHGFASTIVSHLPGSHHRGATCS